MTNDHSMTGAVNTQFKIYTVKVKGKVVPVLLFTDHHAMKAYWGMEV
jgi:hypothetical protein